MRRGRDGRVYTRAPKPRRPTWCRRRRPDPDADGRRPVGIEVDGAVRARLPDAVGQLEFYSPTLADWGWPEHALPGLHPQPRPPADASSRGEVPLIPTFRLPVLIHTRSAQREVAGRDRAHATRSGSTRRDAARLGVATGDLVRVETEIGYFVVKAWVTEGIRPGVVACCHHMGRWRLDGRRASGS